MIEFMILNLVVMLAKAGLEGLAIGAGIGLMLKKHRK